MSPTRHRPPGRSVPAGRTPPLRAARLPTPGDLGSSGDADDDGVGADDDGAGADDDGAAGATVACPECGAENDPAFRYCRDCVAELPGGTPLTGPDVGDDDGLL